MRNKPLKVGGVSKQLSVPTPAEMRLLQVLWDLEEATVDEVVNAHPERNGPTTRLHRLCSVSWSKRGFYYA